jgi:hypothetical protein
MASAPGAQYSFTLMSLVVLAIVGVIIGLAVPNFGVCIRNTPYRAPTTCWARYYTHRGDQAPGAGGCLRDVGSKCRGAELQRRAVHSLGGVG